MILYSLRWNPFFCNNIKKKFFFHDRVWTRFCIKRKKAERWRSDPRLKDRNYMKGLHWNLSKCLKPAISQRIHKSKELRHYIENIGIHNIETANEDKSSEILEVNLKVYFNYQNKMCWHDYTHLKPLLFEWNVYHQHVLGNGVPSPFLLAWHGMCCSERQSLCPSPAFILAL